MILPSLQMQVSYQAANCKPLSAVSKIQITSTLFPSALDNVETV